MQSSERLSEYLATCQARIELPKPTIFPRFGLACCLARSGEIKRRALEIGTSNGGGTTLALAFGLPRPGMLVSLERDSAAIADAKINLKGLDVNIIQTESLAWLQSHNCALDDGMQFDFALVDGGNQEGSQEWMILKEKCRDLRFVAVHDTDMVKGERIVRELKTEPNSIWKEVASGYDIMPGYYDPVGVSCWLPTSWYQCRNASWSIFAR